MILIELSNFQDLVGVRSVIVDNRCSMYMFVWGATTLVLKYES